MTAILVCGQRVPVAPALSSGHAVIVVEDLCRRPGRIGDLASGAQRLVLGVCGSQISLGAVQAEARRAGIDPLGVQIVDLEEITAPLDVVLGARVARAEAFGGSRPEQAKLTMPPRMSRRDLLHRQVHQYVAAPAIEAETCTAASGCRACIDVCPRSALTWSEGTVRYDRVVCEPCGRCVTACPTGAVVNPAVTPAQLEAEVTALLDPTVGPAGPRGIAFTCSRGRLLPSGAGGEWLPVSLPCVGMITPIWLLAPLLMGAGATAAIPCRDTGCPLGDSGLVEATVDFCRELLAAVGDVPERVSAHCGAISTPLPTAAVDQPFGPAAASEIVRAIDSMASGAVAVDHECSPLGVVALDAAVCTACTQCARACPTDALRYDETSETVTITFDAASCVACGQCLGRCPEIERDAITLRRRTDRAAIDRGPITVMSARLIRCQSCGAPIAPEPTLDRIAAVLAPENPSLADLLQRHCLDCRSRVPTS